MEQIRITGVPEHFNFPWQLLVKEQPFLKDGVNLVWEDESRGFSKGLEKSPRLGLVLLLSLQIKF